MEIISWSVTNEIIGVNISKRKSGTERTKKHKKWEFVIFPTNRGHNWYCSTLSRCYTDLALATITRDIFIPCAMWPGLSRCFKNQAKHTILQSELVLEHWKLVAESSEFHLTLSRPHRAHFFQHEIRKRSGTFEVKSGMVLKKREFKPESGNVDTYVRLS